MTTTSTIKDTDYNTLVTSFMTDPWLDQTDGQDYITVLARVAIDGHNTQDTDPATLTRMAALIDSHLSYRDTIILSAADPTADKTVLERMAFHPHRQDTVDHLWTVLHGLQEGTQKLDQTRARRVLDLLAAMAGQVEGGPSLYGATAYIQWLMGQDRQAEQTATKAINLDPNCTLATLVTHALERHIHLAQA
ncbi:hypothetical protein CRD60_04525 [Bifidobacterium aemilianum]|uniref:Tetratricopeptide repeat protein n=1 Tax=Bifidobacterium aemilianum TaxID=2493120 RepID=A0A366K7Z5_9BIFI|nr:hypothetical protein [Bifidobacterium aemilianum]RBP97856.1 hypothetical protein CRD60_04525 [Bifidobacterium aemilianum]